MALMLEKCSWLLAYSGPQVQRRPCGGPTTVSLETALFEASCRKWLHSSSSAGHGLRIEGLEVSGFGFQAKSSLARRPGRVPARSLHPESRIPHPGSRADSRGCLQTAVANHPIGLRSPNRRALFREDSSWPPQPSPDRDPDRGPGTNHRPATLPAVPGCRSRSRQPALLGHRKHPGSAWHPEPLPSSIGASEIQVRSERFC